MKYLLGMLMLFSVLLGLVVTSLVMLSCSSSGTGAAAPAVSEGAAMGYRDMIHVRVGFERGAITEITVIESREDPAVGGAAMEELADLVLMYNTTELDAVSGATETSEGFLEAVENAILDL